MARDGSDGERLDEVLAAYVAAYGRYRAAQGRLGEGVRAGFLSLATARHAMGQRRVSALQYPARKAALEARARIDVAPAPPAPGALPTGLAFVLAHHASADESTEPQTTAPGTGTGNGKGTGSRRADQQLRHRGAAKGAAPPQAAGSDADPGEGKGETEGQQQQPQPPPRKQANPDPLRWFGVLVNPALRRGQQQFRDVTSVCAEVAGLQSELHALEAEYRTLAARLGRT